MKNLDERYFKDPMFSKVVDLLVSLIREQTLSPGEVREAALFAQMKVELERPQCICISENLKYELRLRGL